MMVSTNSLSSRMIQMGDDSLGRWTYQTYQGKRNIRVTIFSIYQVVDSATALHGNLTVASQQHAMLLAANDPLTDPRQAFCRDIQVAVQKFQSEGHDIIIVGDFNEVLGENQSGITQVATGCQLVDVMTAKHPGMPHPATFMRGRTRIDYVLASQRVSQAVRFCGYEAFQNRVLADHRAYYVDFDTNALFGTPLQ